MIRNPGRLFRALLALCLFFACPWMGTRSQSNDSVAQALEQGKLYESKHKWELASESYRKADKLSHHSSAEALIHIALIEKKAGWLSDAVNDAKKAVAVAGDNKLLSIQARLLRATLLAAMANKPSDNKLKDAEAELRTALTLGPREPLTHLNLGLVLLKQEKDAEGVAVLKNFVALPTADPKDVAEAKLIIANPVRARTPFVPNFSVATLENQLFSNASFRGKVVLLDFWGTWCPPCRASVPILKNIQKKYAGKPFQLLSISSDDDEDVLKTFVQAQQMNWAEYLDSSGELQHKFKVDSFPTYLVVDKDGVIRFRQSGLSSETQMELEEAINKALKKESDPNLARIAAQGDNPARESEEDSNSAKASSAASHVNAPSSTATAATTPVASSHLPASDTSAANVYKNSQLGLRYVYPDGWKVATAETLRAANAHLQEQARAALEKQRPQDAASIRIIPPSYIFYASQRGDGSPERASLPSISMQTEPTRLDTVDEDQFRLIIDKMASMTQLKPLAPASAFELKKHKFVRADFERSSGALRYYLSFVQTVAGDFLLKIDVVAETPEQLNKIAETLRTMEIVEPE